MINNTLNLTGDRCPCGLASSTTPWADERISTQDFLSLTHAFLLTPPIPLEPLRRLELSVVPP